MLLNICFFLSFFLVLTSGRGHLFNLNSLTMKKLLGLFFAFVLMVNLSSVPVVKASEPAFCFMYMANCSGERMSLSNCKGEHTAERCASGAVCNNC
jgi:hypothetical protein